MRLAGVLLAIMVGVICVTLGFAWGVHEEPTLAQLSRVACSQVYSADAKRVWVPAGEGCGPAMVDLSHIVLRDGRTCDYVYDQVKAMQLRGLWCDVRSNDDGR